MGSLLDWGPFSRVRRNHALEHATLQVLAEQNHALRLAGYSDPDGFWVVGGVSTEELQAAVDQALARLNQGESNLAIHPYCGTNLVASGMLAGSLAWLAMLGTGKELRQKVDRFPVVLTLVTLGLLLAQPLGPFLQARVTTAAQPGGLHVTAIHPGRRGEMPTHRVLTSG